MTLRDMAIFAGTGLALAGFAFALSAFLCAQARKWGPTFGLVDFPGGPLKHRVPVSLGGGVAIWMSTIAVLGIGALVLGFGQSLLPETIARHVDGLWYRAGELAIILGLASLVMVIGLVDDLFGLGWRFRLGSQVILATILATYATRVTLFWPFTNPVIGVAATVVWLVILTNAFNFLDNMDGLAAGVGLIASLMFAAAQARVGSLFAPAVLLVLAGVLAGFLKDNWYPARLFMGSAGSDFLGFLLGALTIAGTYYRYGEGDSPFNVLSPLLVMAVPLYEAASVFVLWLGERHDVFTWNRHHFSYRLLESGLTPPQAVRAILLVSLGAGLGAVMLHRIDALGAILVVGQTACLMGVVAILEFSVVRRQKAARHRSPSALARLPETVPPDSGNGQEPSGD
jgi:UDP-GlcNAc:undecaprenyl-phosphate/decaprenyl-phosphate GlcNAc-1-phosphate transferase